MGCCQNKDSALLSTKEYDTVMIDFTKKKSIMYKS